MKTKRKARGGKRAGAGRKTTIEARQVSLLVDKQRAEWLQAAKEAGFNQSELLRRAFDKAFPLPAAYSLLKQV